MIGPKGEKVCLISCSENKNQRRNIRCGALRGFVSGGVVRAVTCQAGADATTVDSAVTGAGLVNNVIKT